MYLHVECMSVECAQYTLYCVHRGVYRVQGTVCRRLKASHLVWDVRVTHGTGSDGVPFFVSSIMPADAVIINHLPREFSAGWSFGASSVASMSGITRSLHC